MAHQLTSGYRCKSPWPCSHSPASRKPKTHPEPSKHLLSFAPRASETTASTW